MIEQWGKHMEVQVIESKELLETVEPFKSDICYGNGGIPKTYGYIGFAKGEGFYQTGMSGEKSFPLKFYKKIRTRSIKTVR